jgi:adenylate cyclase class 2
MAATLEREIKLRYDNPAAARAAVLNTGATLVKPRRLQTDALFDTPEGLLSPRQSVLRVRRDGDRSYLTLKNPAAHPTMKLREEIETTIGDAAAVTRILEELGLRAWFRYEKYREEFALPEVVIAIDETPVGTFVEIEGSERSITAVAFTLGYDPADYVLDSYRTLYVNDCAARGVAPTHMLFSAD